MASSSGFSLLRLQRWRQFDHVEIRFDDRLTVLTGANGTGKTTILNLLSRHFGWNLRFVSSVELTKDGLRNYFSDYWEGSVPHEGQSAQPDSDKRRIGSIEYKNSERAILHVPTHQKTNKPVYHVGIEGQNSVPGLFIPSHRPLYIYQLVEKIPTSLDAKEEMFNRYADQVRQRYTPMAQVPSGSFSIKENLISLATFGYGNKAVARNNDAVRIYEEFEHILRNVLPPSLGFRGFRMVVPDVMLMCDSGNFSLDSASGGVAAIIDLCWQIHLYSLQHSEFVVVIDEPENHLHPEMQKQILPSFLESFPRVQFIVSTHNPFVVSSVSQSNVYVFNYTDERKVRSSLLQGYQKTGSADDILRDVLGVDYTVPNWVERYVRDVMVEFTNKKMDREGLEHLKRRLNRVGLDKMLPDVLLRVDEKKR